MRTKSGTLSAAVDRLLDAYPRIYFACHTRHVRDPQTQRLLSRHQASVLDHLDEVEPTTLMDLARHMGVTPGTMSIAIDRLERKGYVRRTDSAAVRTFTALVSRDELIQQRLLDMAKLCGGSLTPLLTHLVRQRRLSERERRELRELIAELERGGRPGEAP